METPEQQRRSTIGQFAQQLKHSGLSCDAVDLADMLWLAQFIEPQHSVRPEEPTETTIAPTSALIEQQDDKVPDPEPSFNIYTDERSLSQQKEIPSEPQPSAKNAGMPFPIPAAPAIRARRDLARSLRPLMRKIPSRLGVEIDEEATVKQIAEIQIPIPVLRATLERWLDVELVVESSKTTMLWERTIAELQHLLEYQGAFQRVRTWRLEASPETEMRSVHLFPRWNERLENRLNQRPRSPGEILDPLGRRLVLFVSDCTSPLWRRGIIYETLYEWSQSQPVAVVQMLPERLWLQTALSDGHIVRLGALVPGLSNAWLKVEGLPELDYGNQWGHFDELDESEKLELSSPRDQRLLILPIITLEPEPMQRWARVVAGGRDEHTPGRVFEMAFIREIVESSIETPSQTARQRVALFRAAASKTARQLAGLMAATPVSLPVIDLLRDEFLPDAEQSHVAEVFLSGLLYRCDTDDDGVCQYEFFADPDNGDRVRDLLVDGVPVLKTMEILDRLSQIVAEKAGSTINSFDALLEIVQDSENTFEESVLPFARVGLEVLHRLGGEYDRIASRYDNLNLLQSNSEAETEPQDEQKQLIQPSLLEVQGEIQAIQEPQTVLSQFQSFIQYTIEGFVGREYVFDAIQTFIQQNPKGYFTIIGDPGMGKSAILAKYVQDNECIAHFNFQLQGPNRTDQFLESVCKQLITRYQLPYDPLPSNVTRDGEFLGQLLDEVSQRRNGQPVVIGIDALDEVDPGSYRDANILYLPPHLPDGVYVIMTRRRGVEVPFTTYAPLKTINLLDYQIDSQRDVRLYIQNRVDKSEHLRQQIDERQETIFVFVDKIVDKSENNFMYLRYILHDIEKGLYKDYSLESFPPGLQGYYDFHWRRMGMTANPLPDAKIKIIYILGAVKQPVSRQQICDFSGEDAFIVQTVLSEWKQFLHEIFEENKKYYSLYHSSFRDFLHSKDILQKTGLTIPAVHRLIAKDQVNKWKNRRRHE